MILDNGLIYLENGELIDKFSFIDEIREVPEYLQKNIINIVFDELGIKKRCTDIVSSLRSLPEEFIRNVICNIDINMYSFRGKTDYSDKHLTYLMYYLPSNLYKIWHPLLDLLIQGKLKTHIRMMDIGTGPGSAAIGTVEFYSIMANQFKDSEFCIDFTLIDAEEDFLKYTSILLNMVKGNLPKNLKISFAVKNVNIDNSTMFVGHSSFDIIGLSNFINHYEHGRQFNTFDFISGIGDLLNSDGAIIIIEPGNNEECIGLKHLRNSLINNKIYNIYAPCVPLWEKKEKYTCSCFSSYSLMWKKPEIIEYLHDMGLTKVKYRDHVAFNYLILRKDGSTKYPIEPNRLDYSLLREIPVLSKQRFNVKGIVKAKSLKSSSFSICDGSFEGDNPYMVWVNVKESSMKRFESKIKVLNMGELVKIRGVTFTSVSSGKINLTVDEKSKLEINY